MKKIHNLKISDEARIIVFKTNSPSEYNRIIAVVYSDEQKKFLNSTTVKTSNNSTYKKEGLRLLKLYESEYGNRKIS